jgi:hypothetical protein
MVDVGAMLHDAIEPECSPDQVCPSLYLRRVDRNRIGGEVESVKMQSLLRYGHQVARGLAM